jgi:hypothetical protein
VYRAERRTLPVTQEELDQLEVRLHGADASCRSTAGMTTGAVRDTVLHLTSPPRNSTSHADHQTVAIGKPLGHGISELASLAQKNAISMAWIGRKAILEFLEAHRENQLQLP